METKTSKIEWILLVDENDSPQGFMDKMQAHANGGTLHRAFSIFIYNDAGEMLLQKRASSKYHCPGLWTNACCSHQGYFDETIEAAAQRRLPEEFGFKARLKRAFEFVYDANFENGLSEREYDHVFVGRFISEPQPNPKEISDYKWVKLSELADDIAKHPEEYTPWFRIAVKENDGVLLDYNRISKILNKS